MTAEVVILNKSAVALAADSTVTVSSGSNDRKTYNSVNKLFALSKHQPVGVMIYGDASFMGVPWEVVIKEYRRQLQRSSFGALREYVSDFIEFVERADYLKESQPFYVWRSAFHLMMQIMEAAKQRCSAPTVLTPAADIAAERTNAADAIVTEWRDRLAPIENLAIVGADFATQLESRFEQQLREARDLAFEGSDIVLSDFAITTLPQIAAKAIATGRILPPTGLVFAGFGDRQVFPSAITIAPLLVACDRFLFKEVSGKCYEVDADHEAALLPFAQSDVVSTFLDGIDPQINKIVESSVSHLLEDFPGIAMECLKVDPVGKDAEITQLREQLKQVKAEFFKQISDYVKKSHTDPLMDVIAVLPKDELASTAESLVNLTAIKRKMSLEIETVGGPIDVAVISKGDGFIWIKRKHYFKPELNPQFLQTYLER
jgi:hypothetical protein